MRSAKPIALPRGWPQVHLRINWVIPNQMHSSSILAQGKALMRSSLYSACLSDGVTGIAERPALVAAAADAMTLR